MKLGPRRTKPGASEDRKKLCKLVLRSKSTYTSIPGRQNENGQIFVERKTSTENNTQGHERPPSICVYLLPHSHLSIQGFSTQTARFFCAKFHRPLSVCSLTYFTFVLVLKQASFDSYVQPGATSTTPKKAQQQPTYRRRSYFAAWVSKDARFRRKASSSSASSLRIRTRETWRQKGIATSICRPSPLAKVLLSPRHVQPVACVAHRLKAKHGTKRR